MSLAKTASTTTLPAVHAGRRSLLSAAAAVTVGSGIVAGIAASVADYTETPDAELIRLCAEFDVLERHRQQVTNAATTIEEDDIADRVWEDVRRQQGPMLDRICSLPCVTVAGLGALSASLMLWDRGEVTVAEDDPAAPTNKRLMAALMRATLAGRA